MSGTKNTKRGKLTKKFLKELPEGLFLVSNLTDKNMNAVFAEAVSPQSARDDQWKRIVRAEAAQRLCHVFSNEQDYIEWLAPIIKQAQKSKRRKGKTFLRLVK
jgi:hypothetical protein